MELGYRATDGLETFDSPSGSARRSYPQGKFSGTYTGARLEWRWLGIEYGVGTGILESREAPRTLRLRADSFIVRLSVNLGAWPMWDPGRPDLRIGLALPEVFVRVVGASFEGPGDATGPASIGFTGVALGASLIGVRATLGDILFAEVRAGELASTVTYRDVKCQDGTWDSAVSSSTRKWAFNPMLRVGLAL